MTVPIRSPAARNDGLDIEEKKMITPYTNDSILMCDDAPLRGLPMASFRIVCDCGKDRKFVFTKDSWDIFPCPYCCAPGVMSND